MAALPTPYPQVEEVFFERAQMGAQEPKCLLMYPNGRLGTKMPARVILTPSILEKALKNA